MGGCTAFPANNVWNARIDKLPVDSRSGSYVGTIGASNPLHPDYGTAYGLKINYVNGSQAKVPVSFVYAGESDRGPYPIPPNVAIQGPPDRHAVVVDTTHCTDYELYGLQKLSSGWQAGSGAIFPLTSNTLRPAGWTSADAAGLPMLPGLVRYEEILSGHINHAIRFTAPQSRAAYIWPARHYASSLTGAQYPPLGQRFRLKANYDISSFPPHVQVILKALKEYGMILADNGGAWFITGTLDSRWNDSEMHAMTRVIGADFEAVNESSLMMSTSSAQVKTATSTAPTPGAPAGWVNVVSKNSGKCMGVVGASKAAAATMEQATCVNGLHQEFSFTQVTGGYKVTVRNSGQALDVRGGPSIAADGALLQQYTWNGGANQIWKLVKTADGYYEIVATSSNKCADVSGVSKLDHAAVHQWSCWGGDNQKWSFVPAS